MWAQVIESPRKCFISQAQRSEWVQAAVFPSLELRSTFVKPNMVSVTQDELVKIVLESRKYASFVSTKKLPEGPHPFWSALQKSVSGYPPPKRDVTVRSQTPEGFLGRHGSFPEKLQPERKLPEGRGRDA